MSDDIKIKFLEKSINDLQKEIGFMKEDLKVMNKKLEFMQDNNARIAVEEQAVIEGVRHIVSIANKIMDSKKNQEEEVQSKPLGSKDQQHIL